MVKDSAKIANNNQSREISKGCYQANIYPEILSQKRKNTRIEISYYTKNNIGVTRHQIDT